MDDLIDDFLRRAVSDAEFVRQCAARVESFARGRSEDAPTQQELDAVRRIANPAQPRDAAIRLVALCAARSALRAGRAIPAADLAAALGVSRQWVYRRYGSLIPRDVAREAIARREGA